MTDFDDCKTGYTLALGDLYLTLADLMTQENQALLTEIQKRMEHLERLHILTGTVLTKEEE